MKLFREKRDAADSRSSRGRPGREPGSLTLFSGPMCPYTARIRVQIHHRNLPIDVAEPPVGTQSEEYRAFNPMGKIPTLVIDKECYLPESEPISEYLEDRYPGDDGLRPNDPLDLAFMRVFSRMPELYFYPNALTLVRLLSVNDRDPQIVRQKTDRLKRLMEDLDILLGRTSGAFAVGDQFTLADCALTPGLFYVWFVQNLYDVDAFKETPTVRRYWEGLRSVPAAARVISEMEAAFRTELGLETV